LKLRSSRRAFCASLIPIAGVSAAARPSSIFLSDEASPSERWAAEDLSFHIGRMTGTPLRIDTGKGIPGSRRVIAVGRSALTDALAVEIPSGESCVLKTAGETLVIAGGRQRGTMYGVSIFLEKLGFRWFTADVTRIPRTGALRVPRLDEIHRPAFDYREVFFTEAQGREWSARNRLNGHFHKLDERTGGRIVYMPFAHAFYDLVPPDRYFESHPEYFALVSGKRRKERAQLCLTNPAVLDLAMEQAQRWIAADPEISVISISQNDGGGWCECPNCRNVIAEEGGMISGLALRFVNQVAARIPGKTIDMLAYQDTEEPPARARPLANVQIRVCPILACQAHSYERCIWNKPFRQRLEAWTRIAPRLCIWQYSINFAHYLAPFPNYDELAGDIPAFRRAGVKGIFVEGAVSDGGGADDAELRSYLAAQLLWNPGAGVAGEIRGFMDAVYGPAASFMRDYFVLGQEEVRRGEHLWFDQSIDAAYLTPAFLKQGRTLLERASQRAASDPARRRIGRHLLSLDYVEAVRSRRCIVRDVGYGPRASGNINRMVKTAEGLGITNLREGYPITQQSRDWGDVARTYAAIHLSGATVVPELAGRIIAFGSPNILRVADPGELRYPDAGGIQVGLSGDEVAWQEESSGSDTVALTGKSSSGLALRLRISTMGDTLRLSVMVSASAIAHTVVYCRAEFSFGQTREAAVAWRGRAVALEKSDGGVVLTDDDLPGGEWAIHCGNLQVQNRFHATEVARCGYNWSYRGPAGLTVTMTLASPEVELAPGESLAMTSEYDLRRTT
jgi:hypothetical protein